MSSESFLLFSFPHFAFVLSSLLVLEYCNGFALTCHHILGKTERREGRRK